MANEPSMEEILSSIKRIIAEDVDVPPAQPPRRARHAFEEEPEVLELTQTVPEPAPAEDAPPIADEVVVHPEPAPAAPPASALLSTATASASREALAALSRMVVKPEDPAADNTLESLVRDLLRPMLKDWLDANLPAIVQATVEREVARISGR